MISIWISPAGLDDEVEKGNCRNWWKKLKMPPNIKSSSLTWHINSISSAKK